MNRDNIILTSIAFIWMTLLILAVFFKVKTAMFFMPIFAVAFVFYLIIVTINAVNINIRQDENKKDTEKTNKTNTTDKQ